MRPPLLLTTRQRAKLLANGFLIAAGVDCDLPPVVKLFTPDGPCTWLLVEIDPADPDRAWGLCDMGLGSPELGYVSLSELAQVLGQLGLSVERDRHFSATGPLSFYAERARAAGRIIA
jgi:hypothetical protein